MVGQGRTGATREQEQMRHAGWPTQTPVCTECLSPDSFVTVGRPLQFRDLRRERATTSIAAACTTQRNPPALLKQCPHLVN